MAPTSLWFAPLTRQPAAPARVSPPLAGAAGWQKLFLRLDDRDLDLGLDLVTQVQFDGIQARLLDRPFEADHILLDEHSLGLEAAGNFGRGDGAVEMAFVVGIGLDSDTGHLGNLFGQRLQVSDACFTRLADADLV